MKTIKRKFYYIAAVLSLIFTLSSCEYVGLGIEIGNGTNSYHESTAVSGLMNGQMNMVFTTIRKFVFTRTIRE